MITKPLLTPLHDINFKKIVDRCQDVIDDPEAYKKGQDQSNSLIVEIVLKSLYGPDVFKYLNQ